MGFMVVDRLAEKMGIKLKRRLDAELAEGEIMGKHVIVVKPLTYMNNSGEVLKALLNKGKVPFANLVVVHDDLDLPCGRIKIKAKGGHGGHKGVQSIIEQIGRNAFLRVKVGIGRPPDPQQGAEYVLSPFSDDQRPLIEEAIKQATEAIETIIAYGKDKAMNIFNKKGGASREY